MNNNLKFDHIRVSFQNMTHSSQVEEHVISKLNKILEFLKNVSNITPLYAEMHLESHKTHPHSKADLHLKTPRFELFTHDIAADLYVAIDNVIDKMVEKLLSEKNKFKIEERHAKTPKTEFLDNKYSFESEDDKVIRDLFQAEDEGDFEENIAEVEGLDLEEDEE